MDLWPFYADTQKEFPINSRACGIFRTNTRKRSMNMKSEISRTTDSMTGSRGRGGRRLLAMGALVSMVWTYGCIDDEVAGPASANTQNLQEGHGGQAKDTTTGGPGSGSTVGKTDTVNSGGPGLGGSTGKTDTTCSPSTIASPGTCGTGTVGGTGGTGGTGGSGGTPVDTAGGLGGPGSGSGGGSVDTVSTGGPGSGGTGTGGTGSSSGFPGGK